MFGSLFNNLLGGKPAPKPSEGKTARGDGRVEARRRPGAPGAKPRPNGGARPAEQAAAEEPEIVEAPPEPEAPAEEQPEKKTTRIVFEGAILTIPGGPLKVAAESRNLCVLFDTGLWLVSQSHKNSPLVTSVALTAKRQGFQVNDPVYVTPDQIREAYYHSDKVQSTVRLDDNAIRRKIVETLAKARDKGANDIHIEVAQGRTKLEFRLESRLRIEETWTQKEGEQFLSAIYSHSSVQSGATANWMEPQAAMLERQNGVDTIQLPDGVISVRCQWMPLADGRYLNMRLSYDSSHIFGEGFVAADVDTLGFTPEQTELIRTIRSTPGRIRAICGPTNQGKTTTLRVMLNRRMAETNMELNCLLIEDPPEGGIIGARQIGVSSSNDEVARERTFQGIIRASLRLDPDIVMLGEVRDMTTASFLFKLALAGRQVYTTLHVYSALAIPQRLRDIGMEPYLVYDPELLYGMMCQRLMRGLCRHCRIPLLDAARFDPKIEQLARRTRAAIAMLQAEQKYIEGQSNVYSMATEPDMGDIFMENIEGCKHCDYKGRKGRTVAAEIVEADAKLMSLLMEDKPDEGRRYWLAPGGLGGISMKMHAIMKVMRGEVSPTDAEFEMGLLIRERELQEIEKVIGVFRLSNYG